MATYPALDIRFDPGPGAGALQDQLYAELDAFEPLAIHEHEAGDGWLVYFPTTRFRADAAHQLATAFGNHVLELSPVDVDDQDWARRSQADLKAICVGRITVRPPWDPLPAVGSPLSEEIDIVIEPSMGFGTGHHATTRLCLEFLQGIELAGRRVIDVGTGSGVLAIAAGKLGSTSVVAVDNDPDALQNARENVARNGVDVNILEVDFSSFRLQPEVSRLQPEVSRLRPEVIAPADVVVANLTGAVLRRFADVLRSLVVPGGAMIVSGFSPDECDEVVAALAPGAEQVRVDGEWAAALVRRPASPASPTFP